VDYEREKRAISWFGALCATNTYFPIPFYEILAFLSRSLHRLFLAAMAINKSGNHYRPVYIIKGFHRYISCVGQLDER
jgi:hypothetical protein